MPRCAARPGAQWLSLSARDNCACISPWMGWHSIGHRGWGLFATGTVHTRDTYSGLPYRETECAIRLRSQQCYSALCCNALAIESVGLQFNELRTRRDEASVPFLQGKANKAMSVFK